MAQPKNKTLQKNNRRKQQAQESVQVNSCLFWEQCNDKLNQKREPTSFPLPYAVGRWPHNPLFLELV